MDELQYWFTSAQLASLAYAGVIDMPRSERWAGKKAKDLGWYTRTVPARGGKGGERTEYKAPEQVLTAIHKFLYDNPNYFDEFKNRTIEQEVKPRRESVAVLENPVKYRVEGNHTGKAYLERYPDVYGSAGPGYAVDNEALVQRIEVSASELHRMIGVPPQHLKIVGVRGYSMEPFLFHGDQVLVDTRFTEFRQDGVYALVHNGELRFKRVRVNIGDSTILLKSDNDGGLGPEVLKEDDANRLLIVGKVIPFKFGHFKL